MTHQKIGSLYKVFYIDVFGEACFQDVFFASQSGRTYSVNRSVLACASPLCRDLLLDLNCYTSDESDVHISTNFTDDELQRLVAFLHSGELPTTAAESLDESKSEVFSAIGLDLKYLAAGVSAETAELKVEPKDEEDFTEELPEHEEEENKRPDRKTTIVKKLQVPDEPLEDLFKFPQEGERNLDNEVQCGLCVQSFSGDYNGLFLYRQHYLRHFVPDKQLWADSAYSCLKCIYFKSSNKNVMTAHYSKVYFRTGNF